MNVEKIEFEADGYFNDDGGLICTSDRLDKKLSENKLNILDLIDPSICVIYPFERDGQKLLRVVFNLP